MKKNYETISANKLVSQAAGVGSIVETANGAFQVSNFDKWPYIKDNKIWQERQVEDQRLLRHLKQHFKKLEHLVEVPWSSDSMNDLPKPKELCATGFRFPSWHFCPKCRRLKTTDKWFEKAHANKYSDTPEFYWQSGGFCSWCKEETQKKDKSSKARNKSFGRTRLVQMNYVLVRPEGDLKDIPWDCWPRINRGNQQNEDDGKSIIPLLESCCANPDLRFKTSGVELSEMTILCENCKNKESLMGLFSNKYQLTENSKKFYFARERTNNGIYSPICFTGLYIPSDELSDNIKKVIKDMAHDKMNLSDIIKNLKYHKNSGTESQITQYFNLLNNNEKNLTEIKTQNEYDFKKVEYDVLQAGQSKSDEFVLKDHSIKQNSFLDKLVAIKRMRLTTVQIGYTRMNSKTVEEMIFSNNDNESENINRKKGLASFKYTSKYKDETNRIPAAITFGEGIFFSLNKDKLNNICKISSEPTEEEVQKLRALREDTRLKLLNIRTIEERRKFIYIHTLTHMIIKELEFSCGYSAASLSERLYIGDEMCGALIYANSGGDASFGGLVSQVERFDQILEAAFELAENCSADPICEAGSDIFSHHSNGAACYACTLLPETTCEMMNALLDRNLLKVVHLQS